MKPFFFISLSLFLGLFLHRVYSQTEQASSPPRGWNSYDSFSWIITEEDFLKNAEEVSKSLLPHGYEYVVVDFLWYRRKEPGAKVDCRGFDVIDEWGRLVPDPDRWPSSKDGKGFTEVAKKVHSMGLKFGIHVMRGLSTQAFDANTLILDTSTGRAFNESGREWHAKDIGMENRACGWMRSSFMSVNTELEAGRAFLRSLYHQYAEWGVDFVKHDCVFGDDLDLDEIKLVSEVLNSLDRPILYSLSPGTSATPTMAKDVSGLVNMYRVTGDDWDTWEDVASHFDVARDFSTANLIGAKGLKGKSWPDLDMLPLGSLTDPGSNEGPHRQTRLSLNEQRTQMTLWAMAKSPLIFGGDAREIDGITYSILTNPTVLEINSFSSNNQEFHNLILGRIDTVTNNAPAERSGRLTMKEITPDALLFGFASCKDPNTNSWSVEALSEDVDQICWKQKLGVQKPLCLYKRKMLLALDEQVRYSQQNHLLYASNGLEFCLNASPRKKLASRVLKRGSFSHCRWDANQLWELTNDGALVSNYSGLCAVVKSVKGYDAIPSGVRSWIATGTTGQIYLAIFNLSSTTREISTKVSNIGQVLGRSLLGASCKCREVWTDKDYEIKGDSISVTLEAHSCALFVLNCT